MFAHWLRHPLISRLQARFAARRPRHPLLRAALGVLGLALLLVLLVAGVFIGIAMLLGTGIWRLLRQRGRPQAGGRVIEGDYRRVRHDAFPHPH
ncbi:hypothetical protein [Luteimonas sp. e5]